MKARSLPVVPLLLLGAAPAFAEKLSQEFRATFERTFRPNRTYAVVMQEGIPTTSVYGVEGDQTASHYSIDVKDGKWETSTGLLDTDQTAADFLAKGEIMELDRIAYKDSRLDLRMVSLVAHKVTRGSWVLKDTKREPVATNFKFFFPFKATGPADVPRVIEYIELYLKPFSSEEDARAFAASMTTGGGERAGAQPTSSKLPTSKKEIKVGMTPLEVLEILGKPEKEISFENKQRWTYPDLTVIFEDGRVKEVKF